MVSTDKLTFEVSASNTVDDITIDLPISVDSIAFTGKILVLCMDVESVRLEFCGTEFSAQVFAIHPETKLIGVGSLVLHAVVDVVIRNAGTRPERDLTAKVWK